MSGIVLNSFLSALDQNINQQNKLVASIQKKAVSYIRLF